jgi:lauroyl/myristoyl acyltransferase
VLTYLLFRMGGLLLPRLPLGLVHWLADRAGELGYIFAGAARRTSRSNLRHVLGDAAGQKQVDATCRQIFRNAARNMADMLRLPCLTAEQVERLVTVHGWEHLEAALARGKGVVLTSAHFGQVEVAAQIMAARGLRPLVLHERLRPRRLYDYVSGLRARMGIQFAPIGDASTLKLAFRTLRQNGLLGVVADRDVTKSGRVVRFFGADARLPDGHVTLALHTGAAIVIAFCLRQPGDKVEVFVEPPMILESTGNREADVERSMVRVISVLERYIGANPEQWVYFQPVWLDTAEKR